MAKYRVATEDGVAEYRWAWQARGCLRNLYLGPGQCALMFKEFRDGRQCCVQERHGPTLSLAAQKVEH